MGKSVFERKTVRVSGQVLGRSRHPRTELGEAGAIREPEDASRVRVLGHRPY